MFHHLYKSFCNFLFRLNVKHLQIQTTARAMDAYASGDSDITEAIFYFLICSICISKFLFVTFNQKGYLRHNPRLKYIFGRSFQASSVKCNAAVLLFTFVPNCSLFF